MAKEQRTSEMQTKNLNFTKPPSICLGGEFFLALGEETRNFYQPLIVILKIAFQCMVT